MTVESRLAVIRARASTGHEGEPWCSLCRGPYPCETITTITDSLEVEG